MNFGKAIKIKFQVGIYWKNKNLNPNPDEAVLMLRALILPTGHV